MSQEQDDKDLDSVESIVLAILRLFRNKKIGVVDLKKAFFLGVLYLAGRHFAGLSPTDTKYIFTLFYLFLLMEFLVNIAIHFGLARGWKVPGSAGN